MDEATIIPFETEVKEVSDFRTLLDNLRITAKKVEANSVSLGSRVGPAAYIRIERLLKRVKHDLKDLETLTDRESTQEDRSKVMKRKMK